MRRLMMCSILLLAAFGDLFAAVTPAGSRGFLLSAQKGGVQEVSITPIEATSLDDDAGIPFDLEDEGVAYDAASGAVTGKRQIATWSFHSNFASPRITIDAPHLRHDDGTEVHYQLAFYYQFKAGEGYLVVNIIVHSGTPYNSSDDTSCLWNTEGYTVAFSDRPVRIMLAEDVKASDKEYPSGSYRATVTVTIEGNG